MQLNLHCRCHTLGQHVEVTASRQTRLQAASIEENLLDLVYEPREVCTVCSLASMQENVLDLVYEHGRYMQFSLSNMEEDFLHI